MQRRIPVVLTTLLLLVGVLAAPAAAEGHPEFEPHGHMLVLGVEVDMIDGAPHLTGYRKCIDMPVTPLRGHHDNIHFGRGGQALIHAGHAFVPSFNFPTPWESCAEFAGFLPFPIPQG